MYLQHRSNIYTLWGVWSQSESEWTEKSPDGCASVISPRLVWSTSLSGLCELHSSKYSHILWLLLPLSSLLEPYWACRVYCKIWILPTGQPWLDPVRGQQRWSMVEFGPKSATIDSFWSALSHGGIRKCKFFTREEIYDILFFGTHPREIHSLLDGNHGIN